MRNPSAYSPQAFIEALIEGERDSAKREQIIREAEDLWPQASALGACWDAFQSHLRLWLSRGHTPSQTPLALALPLIRSGEAINAVARRLEGRFEVSRDSIRRQLSQIFQSAPSQLPTRGRVSAVREALRSASFSVGGLDLQVTSDGLEIRAGGTVCRVSDEGVEDLIRWLVGLWGVPRGGGK